MNVLPRLAVAKMIGMFISDERPCHGECNTYKQTDFTLLEVLALDAKLHPVVQ